MGIEEESDSDGKHSEEWDEGKYELIQGCQTILSNFRIDSDTQTYLKKDA